MTIQNVFIYVLLFFIYSFIGWVMEVTGKLIEQKKFINRGFLIGPYCPIYGYGSILITLLLKKYVEDVITLFIMAILICSILEYMTSYAMEKIFGARWWDYGRRRFNINGRICLETTIPFGLLGLLITYVLNPFFLGLINRIPENILYIICGILCTGYVIDNIVSFKVISHVKLESKKVKDDTEEITEKILIELQDKIKSTLEKKSMLDRRLMNAYPNMRAELKLKIAEKKEKIEYELKQEKMRIINRINASKAKYVNKKNFNLEDIKINKK